MRIKVLLIILCISFISCGKKEIVQNKEILDFERSLSVWGRLKAQHENSYEYVVDESHFFSAVQGITEIEVKKGKVVRREFKMSYLAPGIEKDYPSYIENEAEIGSHSCCTRAVTVDQIYLDCRNSVLSEIKNPNLEFRFEVDQEGILQSCSYTTKRSEQIPADYFEVHVGMKNFRWR